MQTKILLILMSISCYACSSDFFNNYKVTEVSTITVDFEDNLISMDFVPTQSYEEGVNISGEPFTFRLICKTQSPKVCDLKGWIINIFDNDILLVKKDISEYASHQLTDKNLSTVLIPDLNIDRNSNICIDIPRISERECFIVTDRQFKRFFLLDWWEGL
jgi:hypothetical protein